MNVVLQPAAEKLAQEHLQVTVYNSVPIDRILTFSPHLELVLRAAYSSNEVFLWGTDPPRPGAEKSHATKSSKTGDAKRTKWEKVRPGDFVAFTWDNAVQITAIVVATEDNEALAKSLWGVRNEQADDRETWRYIYYLRAVEKCHIPWEKVGLLLRYATTPKGFEVIHDHLRVTPFVEFFQTHRGTMIPDPVDAAKLKRHLRKLELTKTDRKVERTERLEHDAVVDAVFRGATEGTCAFCNETLPRNLLVAAHIKKRAQATIKERCDVHNIAMPMCAFGCDVLFEKGFLGVDSAGLIVRASVASPPALDIHLTKLAGHPCAFWTTNPGARPYFEWHANNTFKC